MARALFASDLHLSGERPAATRRFFRFLEEEASGAGVLYLLGDLFEYWIGDDELDHRGAGDIGIQVAAALTRLAREGTDVVLMHGNRDFLLGGRFCAAAGARLLEDPALVDLDGTATLLMHGDTLCTEDLDYQAWRNTCRSAAWQREFLARPIAERRALTQGLREQSKAVLRTKSAQIMDATAHAVEAALRRHGAARLIHGHTHRPAHHVMEIDGRSCERWVLPDWYGSGGYLEIAAGRPRLVRF